MIKCTKCNTEKAESEFNRDRSRPDGLRHICKACKHAYYKARPIIPRQCPSCGLPKPAWDYPRTPEGNRSDICQTCLLEAGTKVCSACHELKPTTDYYKNRAMPSGLGNLCKPCFKIALDKHYWSPGPASGRAYNAAWVKRIAKDPIKGPAYHARINKAAAKYRSKHSPQVYARWAVYKFREAGILTPTNHCMSCEAPVSSNLIEAHHWAGYDRDHRLDVVWLCHDCHVKTLAPDYVERKWFSKVEEM